MHAACLRVPPRQCEFRDRAHATDEVSDRSRALRALRHEPRGQGAVDGPADDHPGEGVEHDTAVEPALARGVLGDVGQPQLVRARAREHAPNEIQRHHLRHPRSSRQAPCRQALQTELAHDRLDGVVANDDLAAVAQFRGDRADQRLIDPLDVMQQQIDIVMLTPPRDVFPDGRFEMYYRFAGADHAAAVDHVIAWLGSYDQTWREYLSVGLPGDAWTS